MIENIEYKKLYACEDCKGKGEVFDEYGNKKMIETKFELKQYG